MRNGVCASLLVLLLSACTVLGQTPKTDGSGQLPWRSSTTSATTQTTPSATPASSSNSPTPIQGHVFDEQSHVDIGSAPVRSALWTAEADYLLWIFPNRGSSFGAASTSPPKAAALVSLGDEHLHRHLLTGGQFTLGYWNTEVDAVPTRTLRTSGVEIRYFFLGERSASFVNESSPDIVRPFFDLNNGKESGVIVAAPGLATGGILATARGSLRGGEANLWKNIYHDDIPYNMLSVDVMGGFRYLGLDTDIDIQRRSRFFGNLAAFPDYAGFENNVILERDAFSTTNNFYGGQIGVAANVFFDRLMLTGMLKLALGTTCEELTIEGAQTRFLPKGKVVESPGGLLALPSNIGTYRRNHFAQVPEAAIKLSWAVFDRVTLTTAVNGLYWSRLARAGDQIQRQIDITQIPNFPDGAKAAPTGFSRPGVSFDQSSLWVVGVTVGMEIAW